MNATFYVVSGWANRNASGYMRWWQVDDLYRDGNEIGGMGADHKDLTQVYNSDWMQDYAYKRDQVCNDRQRLAQLGYDPQSFAYPAGAYRYTFPDGSTVQDIVKGCGYLAARAVGGLSPADQPMLRRYRPGTPMRSGHGPHRPRRCSCRPCRAW
jgi:peptidoglycan/xylan/chitin deacetylase (PgdA/CDA1 family)